MNFVQTFFLGPMSLIKNRDYERERGRIDFFRNYEFCIIHERESYEAREQCDAETPSFEDEPSLKEKFSNFLEAF